MNMNYHGMGTKEREKNNKNNSQILRNLQHSVLKIWQYLNSTINNMDIYRLLAINFVNKQELKYPERDIQNYNWTHDIYKKKLDP